MSKIKTGNAGIRDGNLNLMYSSLITNTILQQLISVTTAAKALPTTALAERVFLQIQNDGSGDIFIGSSSVASSGAAQGIRMRPGAVNTLAVEPDVKVYAIAGAGSHNVIILEGS